jgi:Peptidase M10 serralysin C terminal
MTKIITYSSDFNPLNTARTNVSPVPPGNYFATFGPPNPGINNPDTNYLHSSYSLTNNAFLNAIKMWENFVDVDFQSGTSANQINFTYWNTSVGGSTRGAGTTFSTTSNFATATKFEIFINQNPDQLGVPNTTPSYTNWGNWVIAHEIGHTLLGVGHPSDSNPALYGDLRTSIMINPVQVTPPNPVSISSTTKIPLTPGMQDIATLQAPTKLGPSTTSSLNDAYTFIDTGVNFTASTATATKGGGFGVAGSPSLYVMTIYDSGSTDAIDARGMTTKNYINLSDGQFSMIGADKNSAPTGALGSVGYGVEYNVGIANGTMIEWALGGSAADTILGNAASNVLAGGKGSDTITGGLGGDYFRFDAFNTATTDKDVITDFTRAQGDKIDLSLIDANTIAANDQAFSFISTAAFGLGVAGQLRINTTSNVIEGDVNGNGIADFQIALTGVNLTVLVASDFIA